MDGRPNKTVRAGLRFGAFVPARHRALGKAVAVYPEFERSPGHLRYGTLSHNLMKQTRWIRTRVFLPAIAALLALPLSGADSPPDLTLGNKRSEVDRSRTYNLGSTGLRGWIEYRAGVGSLEFNQGRTTALSRQILVTHVGTPSPASGVMQVDDVILGVNGKPFTDDARKSFAKAITEAEKASNGGLLKLIRWRDGKTENVQLKLRVMGTYSDTALFRCPKSKLIYDEACKHLEKEVLTWPPWGGSVSALALLATGNPAYLPRVRDYAHKIGPQSLKLELKPGMVLWDWGYNNIFLCEYYLLTGDKEVLHAINEYTVTLAKGQGMYGTFGHGLSMLTPAGKLHGSIAPYGPVNSCGLPGNISIVLGRKCGIKDPEVDAAIERASRFFGYYVNKGSIPYGEHLPEPLHDDNGKSSMAAIFFGLQGNRNVEAKFFAKMATAAYENRELGHTGQGFSYLWGPLGANVGGPLATEGFWKEIAWHLDLVRRCDGSFTYDGGETYGPGQTEDNTYFGKSGYNGLTPAACYVLNYALPLRKLYITGKDANQANWLTKNDVAEAIASGRFDVDRKTKTTEELIAAMSDWSPTARMWAAEELGQRPGGKDLIPRLIKLAEGSDAGARQGAAEALGYLNSPEALPVLTRLLSHEDRWLRFKAAAALRRMGPAAKPAQTEMLRALVTTAEPLQPVAWADPIQLASGNLAAALFGGLLHSSIEGIDPKLLYPAIRAIAQHPDGMARSHLAETLGTQLKIEDVQALAPDILAAIKTPCPADTMFQDGIRMGAFKALTKYHFKEAIPAAVTYAQTQGGHGSQDRTEVIMKELIGYGTAARPTIPGLKALIEQFNNESKTEGFPDWANKLRIASVEKAIKEIEAAKDQPAMRTIGPTKAAGTSP